MGQEEIFLVFVEKMLGTETSKLKIQELLLWPQINMDPPVELS
jgi:hypothetical protein